MRDAPQESDPLRVELMVGTALTEAALLDSSTPYLDELPTGLLLMVDKDDPHKPGLTDPRALRFDASTEHGLWDSVIQAAAGAPSRRSLALLRAAAVLLPDAGVAARAAAAADELAASGLAQPRWAEALSGLEPDSCWAAELGGGYVSVLASYRYGERPHGLCVFIDNAMGGVAKNGFATVEIDGALRQWPDLAPVPAPDAHRLIAEAYELTYARRDLPVDPDVHRLRLAALRRVRLFGL